MRNNYYAENKKFFKSNRTEIFYVGLLFTVFAISMFFYCNKKINSSDTFLVMPESIMINFLTDYSPVRMHYSMTPPYIETFGEERIIADIKKNPPDYVFINN